MFWKMVTEYGFEILLGLCILFILLYAFYRFCTGQKGTWSNFRISPNRAIRQVKPKKGIKESKGETECRRVLEMIFNKPFPKDRPSFLNNPVTGGNFNLELDCFNKELKIAVEYNGAQHYKYIPYFHKNKEAFLNQKYRDEMKRTKCKENGIKLIEVPYTVPIPDIERYIKDEL